MKIDVYIFILIQFLLTMSQNERTKRFLIVPPTSPTRHQLISGIGVPVSLQRESVTAGWVLKAQYFLPTQVSDLKPFWFFDNDDIEERSLHEETKQQNWNSSIFYIDPMTGTKVETDTVDVVEIDTKKIQKEENEIEINYQNDYVWRTNYQENQNLKNQNSRWNIYKMIEAVTEHSGFNGKECLLRSICEAAVARFTHRSGLLGELMHIILSPATTKENSDNEENNDYIHAEKYGKTKGLCGERFSKCKISILDMFSGTID